MGDGMDLMALVGLAVTATAMAVFLKEPRLKTAALLVMLAAGCLILLRLLSPLSQLLTAFFALGRGAGADGEYLGLLLRIIGLAYVAEFGAQLCRDAGEGAAALKIELAAKTAILLLALPVLAAIITSLSQLL